jgi:type III restriction enzyme
MMLQLKGYQEKALESLRLYLRACDDMKDASLAFYKVTENLWGQGMPYRAIKEPSELADIPYVCLRLPTGGGKTLLACHVLGVANREYLRAANSLVLWLVPSNAIREQTINALRDASHPYRQALEATLGNVTVMDVSEALYVQAGTLLGSTVIIVATLQAFRVEEKEGRKVYESAGALQHHFTNLPSEIAKMLDHDEKGNTPYSLANVMRIHRPLVIVDEAHNARTGLSFDTLARFRPSAIIEFTATPDKDKNPSNVLHSVSAMELKAENMIKLPIRLETQTDWQSLFGDAIAQRVELEKSSRTERQKTGDYIRPIMLIQAQPKREGRDTLTVEVIEKSLVEDHHIPENQIARATGEDRGLEGIDLADEKCEIRYVITVQALREGWDCPFAYVLCSVAEQRSMGAVEQILGRILRLPYCKPKEEKALDKAYAFVASANFAEAAGALVDALVENGFNKQEAEDFIKPMEAKQTSLGSIFDQPALPSKTVSFKEVPPVSKLSPELQSKIEIDPKNKTITFKNVLSREESDELKDSIKSPKVRESVETEIQEYKRAALAVFQSPAEKGVLFRVPVLCIKKGQQLELFEEEHLLADGWDLNAFDAVLTDQEFGALTHEGGEFGEIDINKEGQIGNKFIPELNRQLQLLEAVENWSDAQLIHWIDRNLSFNELTAQEKEKYLAKMIGNLLDVRAMGLSQLVRKKFLLRKIAENKIKGFRTEARGRIYQKMLFDEPSSKIVVSPERCFNYPADQYPARTVCPASSFFRKHYYPKVGELEDRGEEFLCAQLLDQMEEVEFWVRNLERQSEFSFWLQTATDKFYPDFVCKLKDGRFLVVEYKGADRWSNDDSKEKRRLGELWALKSNGQCLFIMPKGNDLDAIKAIVKV